MRIKVYTNEVYHTCDAGYVQSIFASSFSRYLIVVTGRLIPHSPAAIHWPMDCSLDIQLDLRVALESPATCVLVFDSSCCRGKDITRRERMEIERQSACGDMDSAMVLLKGYFHLVIEWPTWPSSFGSIDQMSGV
jgi:hypothetical protein